MTGGTHGRHHPPKRMIQYFAAGMFNHRRHGIPGCPVEPGDDRSVLGGAR